MFEEEWIVKSNELLLMKAKALPDILSDSWRDRESNVDHSVWQVVFKLELLLLIPSGYLTQKQGYERKSWEITSMGFSWSTRHNDITTMEICMNNLDLLCIYAVCHFETKGGWTTHLHCRIPVSCAFWTFSAV